MGIYNEYSRLEEVILGISPKIFLQKDMPKDMEAGISKIDKGFYRLGLSIIRNKPVPDWISRRFQAELDSLNKVLVANGVFVHRLDPIEPLIHEPEGLIQMFPRDLAMTVGSHFIIGNLQMPMRKKEYRGFEKLLPVILQNRLQISSIDPLSGNFLEGGDVIVDDPYIFVGINTYATNLAGLRWLESEVGKDFKIVPVHIKDPSIMHLDCCMTIIGPKMAVINKASLVYPLPDPLKDFDFIEVNSKTRKELGTNVLVIEPGTVVVQKRHMDLQERLKVRGFNVITIEFTYHAKIFGAFRCATCPIRRSNNNIK